MVVQSVETFFFANVAIFPRVVLIPACYNNIRFANFIN